MQIELGFEIWMVFEFNTIQQVIVKWILATCSNDSGVDLYNWNDFLNV